MNHASNKAPVFDEVCETTGIALTWFMNEVAMLNPEISELTILFGAIDTACKAIANLVKGEIKVQGEDQKKLNIITNDLLKQVL
jgi:fructose-1,6-bisphosphatase I